MLTINSKLSIPQSEISFSAIRAQGAGGQNVNKVSSAIHLRFDIKASSLPDICKQKLLDLNDKRITSEGTIVIKAQRFRTQERNRQDALDRLVELLSGVSAARKIRRPTKASKHSVKRRLESKARRGFQKVLRSKKFLD